MLGEAFAPHRRFVADDRRAGPGRVRAAWRVHRRRQRRWSGRTSSTLIGRPLHGRQHERRTPLGVAGPRRCRADSASRRRAVLLVGLARVRHRLSVAPDSERPDVRGVRRGFCVLGVDRVGCRVWASALAGWLVGLRCCFCPGSCSRAWAAGDVKLLAALGAWAGAGATRSGSRCMRPGRRRVCDCRVRWSPGYLATMVRNVWGLLMFWRVAGVQPHPELTLATAAGPRLPYAFPNHRGCSGCAMAPIRRSGTCWRDERGAALVEFALHAAVAAGGHCRHRGLRVRVSALRGDHQRRTRGRAAGLAARLSDERRR